MAIPGQSNLGLFHQTMVSESFSRFTLPCADGASARMDHIPMETVYQRFAWNTKYSSKNRSESDELWERIRPSHGFVAMDQGWTSEQHWPESMHLPSDSSKNVYLLEAYHQLHCLVRVQYRRRGHELIGKAANHKKDVLGGR